MKETLLALSAILAVSTAIVIINANDDKSPHLLGREECTWGPVFWCNNITTSATCDMTDHCIKKVWSNMEVPEDTDDVCTICKNMVKQARDQLESNETQNDIKMVMEGSCDLIPVRLVADECKRLVDEFIPQLVETLASQMNPSVVCSVAGLCNSARIDRLLAEEAAKNFLVDKRKFMLANDELEPSECVKCHTVMAHAKNKINDMPNDEIYLRMMGACGELSSFSDACAAIVTRYFKNIVKHVRTDFNGENICHLSGQCAAKYHQHEADDEKALKVNIRPLSSVGMVDVGDDLPCKLCEQLVGHLRDVLIANTTAIEFKDILEGFCTQTQSFAAECKEIVNKYYSEIYMYLIKGLNSNAVCTMCGLCPAPGKTEQKRISPLLPSEQHRMAMQIMEHARKENIRAKSNIGQNFDSLKAEEKQLPIERLFPPFYGLAFPRKDVNGNNLCDLCEYVIHDVQETLTNPKTIEQIEKVVKNVCHKLPIVINNCDEFIDQYGAALISLLVQEADPAKVCPKLALCAPEALLQALETLPQNKMLQSGIKEKPGCPLCLLAVTDLENQIKSNKTRANIEAALSKLCSHLNKNLKQGCEDFVDSYSDELIDMLVADFSPEEVCVYLKLCNPKKHVGPPSTIMFPMNKDGEIISNEIPEYPLHPIKKTQVTDGPICTVCELVMGYVDKEMRDESTREEFEKILHNACRVLPKKMSKECNDYVQEYGEMVLDILSKDISPKVVCQMIGICKYSMKYLEEEITECSVCNMVISTIDHMLDDPRIDDDIEQTVAKVCDYVPSNIHSQCVMKVKIYGQTMINLFKSHVDPQKMCSKMDLCAGITNFPMKASRNGRSTTDFGTRSCTWGQSYWCASEQNAVKCGMLTTCQELWKSKSAPTSEQIPTVTSLNNLD